jgi:hypothetical protein
MKHIENIGNVVLDYSKYSGTDAYTDGAVEDELLSIVKNHPTKEFTSIIQEKAEWPFLYHLSYLRENTVEWLPIKATDKVLEIGSGCGAITGAISKKCKELTCVELSEKRSLINAYRNKEQKNITIKLGNFTDVETELDHDYDYILLIGVFEYAVSYMGTDTPYEDFLKIIKKHLDVDGRMVIAIENKFGLKYWAGCREDHLGTFFSGLEDYRSEDYVRTFTKPGLEKLFYKAEMKEYSFYYPYPDYKFAASIYSDEYLPKEGELTQNLRNFDRNRMQLFDESKVYSSIIKDGLFPEFSNSFMVILGKPLYTKYVKYANEREERFRISTRIMQTEAGDLFVEKVPLTESAKIHIQSIKNSYDKLIKRYQGSELKWNLCEESEQGIYFEFLHGETLEQKLDDCLLRDDFKGFQLLLNEYMKRVEFNKEIPVSDYDLIFSNIIIGDIWTVIDYEWTFDKITPVTEIAYRACYYYVSSGGIREKLKLDLIRKHIGISEEEANRIIEEDNEFQQYVLGKQMLLGKLREMIGHQVIHPIRLINCAKDSGDKNRVQVYFDYGEGAKEEDSYFVSEAFQSITDVEVSVKMPSNVKYLRIDPCMDSCFVEIVKVWWNEEEVTFDRRGECITNGIKIKKRIYIFETTDPNINFNVEILDWKRENTFRVQMRVSRIHPNMASKFKKKSWKDYLRRKNG